MSFEAFERAIVSPALKRVALHWNGTRGKARLPVWGAIRPAAIASQLPLVWSYSYDRGSDTFRGRLSGNFIDQVFGRNLKGVPMAELYTPCDYPRFFARSKRVVCEPAFYCGEGMVFAHKDRYGQGERIMMPMSSDGLTGDGFFAATDYRAIEGRPDQHRPETGTWFSL
jgi:hypothetical protein